MYAPCEEGKRLVQSLYPPSPPPTPSCVPPGDMSDTHRVLTPRRVRHTLIADTQTCHILYAHRSLTPRRVRYCTHIACGHPDVSDTVYTSIADTQTCQTVCTPIADTQTCLILYTHRLLTPRCVRCTSSADTGNDSISFDLDVTSPSNSIIVPLFTSSSVSLLRLS